jgi:hypothetical protein
MSEPEPCKTLAEALAALQARLPRVAKTAEGQERGGKKDKYADLAMVSEALLPVLADLGLSFSARPTMVGDRFVLHYMLRHVSEQADEGLYPLPSTGSPQQIGSAITYARRYALCAVTGLAPGGDDDDGLAAEAHHQGLRPAVSAQDKQRAKTSRYQAGTSRAARAQEEDPWAQDAPVDHQRAAALREDLAPEEQPGSSNAKQHQQLGILYQQLGITERATRLEEMTDRVGRTIGSAKDLSYAEAESAIRQLREMAAKEGGK